MWVSGLDIDAGKRWINLDIFISKLAFKEILLDKVTATQTVALQLNIFKIKQYMGSLIVAQLVYQHNSENELWTWDYGSKEWIWFEFY